MGIFVLRQRDVKKTKQEGAVAITFIYHTTLNHVSKTRIKIRKNRVDIPVFLWVNRIVGGVVYHPHIVGYHPAT